MADALDRNTVITILANTIAAVARGDDAAARAQILDLAASYAKERQQSLPGLPSPSRPVDHYAAAVERLFAYWQEKCEHPQARLTPERRTCVIARLRACYSEAEIKCAIDGAAAAAYVSKDSGKKFDDLELICRNGGKLEDFIDRGLRAGSTHTVGLTERNGGPPVAVEQHIAQLRHNMSMLRSAGRDIEYEAAAKKLDELLAARKGKRS